MSELVLVVDFDGTVYRGDEPVRRYARRIAEALPAGQAEHYLGVFERYLAEGVAAAKQSTDTVEAAALREAVDGWGAAHSLAQRCHGVPPDVTEAAFRLSRQDMLDPGCELEVVTPLVAALSALRGSVRVLLATNSPRPGLDELLDRMGVAAAFDGLVPGAAKPDGLRRLLRSELGDDLRDRPWRLFSLGDHYFNDLAPAVEIGGAAGYIDRFGRADGPATAQAPVVERLLPAIHAWVADPRSAAVPAA
ncbi:HAD family hydrolase [Actinospica sp.]|uniref:HAD family hydrolase n=1 Tax=Actinospica sp. TaxID=1872142 RepID=UPI002D0B0F38|nr:HAD family hydrolase [Actinospica sp.]HWG28161.1 HAD family hydrolase [Actinospica sp.]